MADNFSDFMNFSREKMFFQSKDIRFISLMRELDENDENESQYGTIR